ncbi:hypothetical protein COLO4_25220 [Corchorus olitorius]|uniref:Snf2 ATP coupling domain-containing protein n=1 Tax=Corchorus olitorius TaxID=93759 RepID=A0A1R3I432_9ROSI|nr:hypothetical protein COLO4_25220 [Corchorus olitorius]
MTRLLDVMEDYLTFKQYRYLRLDGHTSGTDRGALIDKFNKKDSPFFIFLLRLTCKHKLELTGLARRRMCLSYVLKQYVIVIVGPWGHVQTVEEQVRAAAEHKLGVANQSITAGFFDNNTSAEDRREYLESLLRECKKEEAAPVLDDDALNDLLARSESEIDVFESIDKQRREEELAKWKNVVSESGMDGSKPIPPLPSRLVTDDDLKEFYEAMKLYDAPKNEVPPNVGVKRKGESLGGLDTRRYGRGKRAREVRSYEEQWTEEEFEKMCQVDSPESPKVKEETPEKNLPKDASMGTLQQPNKDATPPSKRGRGRPRRVSADKTPTTPVPPAPFATSKVDVGLQKGAESSSSVSPAPDPHNSTGVSQNLLPNTASDSATLGESNPPGFSPPVQSRGQGRKSQTGGQAPRRRGKKQEPAISAAADTSAVSAPKLIDQSQIKSVSAPDSQVAAISGAVPGASTVPMAECANLPPTSSGPGISLNSQSTPIPSGALIAQSAQPCPTVPVQGRGSGRKAQSVAGTPRRRGKKQAQLSAAALDVSAGQGSKPNPQAQDKAADAAPNNVNAMSSNQERDASDPTKVIQEQVQGTHAPAATTGQIPLSAEEHHDLFQSKQPARSRAADDSSAATVGPAEVQIQNADVNDNASLVTATSPEGSSQKDKSGDVCDNQGGAVPRQPALSQTSVDLVKNQISEDKVHTALSTVKTASSVASATMDCLPTSNPVEGPNKTLPSPDAKIASGAQPFPTHAPVASAPQSVSSSPAEPVQVKRPGRKPTNRAEAPRRRGRKPAIPDASSGQDSRVNSQPQSKSRDSLVNKATAVKSNQDSSPHDTPNVTQTADVNDVARVMKEIFSETCSSKTKVGESAGSEGRNTSPGPLSSKMVEEVAKSQGLDGKKCLPPHEKAATACDIPTEENRKQSETEPDMKGVDGNTSVVVMAADSLKPECKTLTSSDNIAGSRQISSEHRITESEMQIGSACPLDACEKIDASQGTPAPLSDHTSSKVQSESPGAVHLPQTSDSDKTNIEPASEESPKADNNGDNHKVVLSVSCVEEPAIKECETDKESPLMTESDSPSIVEKSPMEGVVPGHPEASQTSSNLGGSSMVEDAAPACQTATLAEAPLDNCVVDGQSGASEAKEDPLLEPAITIAAESADLELAPQDGRASEQPLVVKDREDDGVKIDNMEVDPSETKVSSLKNFTAESSSRDPTLEVDGGDENTEDDHFQVTEVKPFEPLPSKPAVPTLEIAAPVPGMLQDNNIDCSWKDADPNESEEKPPVVVMTPISKSVSLVPQCQSATSSENISDSRQPCCETTRTESNMDVDCKVHMSSTEKKDFASPRSKSREGDSTDFTVGPSCSQTDLSVASLTKVEPHQLNQNSSGNETGISSNDSPEQLPCEAESCHDKSGSLEVPTILDHNSESEVNSCTVEAPALVETNFECEAEPSLDKSGLVEAPAMVENSSECETKPCPDESVVLEVPAMVEINSECEKKPCADKSGMVEAPAVVEINSECEAEPSMKSSPIAYVENVGSAAMSTEPDVNDVPPPVTSNISQSSVHSGTVELPAITKNELGKETELSLDRLQSSATDRGSVEALNVPTESHALIDHHSKAAAAERCGEATIGGLEICEKSDDPGAAPVVEDMAISDNLDGPSSESENRRDYVSEPIHLGSSESTSTEVTAKDDQVQLSSAVEIGDRNSVDISNEEVHPSQQPAAQNDLAIESANIDLVLEVHGEKSSVGIKSIGGDHVDEDVEPLEAEASVGKDIVAIPSSIELVPGDQSKVHLEVGVASTEDSVQVENTVVEPSEERETSSEVTTKESPNGEHVLNHPSDELPGIEKTEADHVGPSSVGPNCPEVKASPLQSGDSDHKELAEKSDIKLVEACNVESNPTEGPSSTQGISDESANQEVRNDAQARTELQVEDHAEASQQAKVEVTDVPPMEIDPMVTEATEQSKVESNDVSNMEIDPPEKKVPSPGPGADETNA